MRLKQFIFLKFIVIYVIFFFCLYMVRANVNVSNVKEIVGNDTLAQQDQQIIPSNRSKSGTIEQTEEDGNFSKLASSLLAPISDDKKNEMKAELKKMSQNKEFLDELTPERLKQVKKDIGNYKSQFKSNNKKNTGVQKQQFKQDTNKLSTTEKTKQDDITFNFPNVTLQEFARFVANLNKKILIGSKLLQGNVTIKTPKKLSLEKLMEVFGALLNSHGMSYVITGNYMQIFQKSDSDIKVYKINYLKSADIAKSLSDIFKMSFNVGGVPQRIMINSLDQANSIIVLAPKEKHIEIAKAIEKMDWRRRQVLMEIKVVELTYTDKFAFGVTGGISYHGTTGGVGPEVSKWQKPTPAANPTPPAPPLQGPTGDIASYAGLLYDNKEFFAEMEATKSITDFRVLSQPSILTAENLKSEIKIGYKKPIAQSAMQVTTENDQAPLPDIDWKDIGLTIDITPRINASRDVNLDFNMKITNIVSSEPLFINGKSYEYPVIGHRNLQNSATIKDNATLVIGGLLKDEKTVIKEKIPFFGEMPSVGWLFSTTSEVALQTEIIILIKAHVIANVDESRKVTEEAIKKLENYDKYKTKELKKMVKGKRDNSWNVFNAYQYFNNENYRQEEQNLVPQEWGSFGD